MEIETRTTDRMMLINFLKEETRACAKYLGAPGFQYVIGPYTVLRNANILTDEEAGKRILPALLQHGFVEEEEETSGITVPITPGAVRPRINLLNMISARGKLINKAIGATNALWVSKELIRAMKEQDPKDMTGFRELMASHRGADALKGLRIFEDRVVFTGFPIDGPEADTCRDLAEAMVRTAEKQKWSSPDSVEPENERYAFRVWLLTLGMKGKKYAATRSTLLERLDGDGAFRTAAQKEEAMKKRQKEGEKDHEEFILL